MGCENKYWIEHPPPRLVFWAQGNRTLYVPVIRELPQNFPISVKDIGGCIKSSTEDIKNIFH